MSLQDPNNIPLQKPGVENARVIDLISVDKETGEIVLTMVEYRAWSEADFRNQINQLQAKVDSYASYVLDGFMVKEYPQYIGKLVRIELICGSEPSGIFQEFMEAAEDFASTNNLSFVVKVVSQNVIDSYRKKYESAVAGEKH